MPFRNRPDIGVKSQQFLKKLIFREFCREDESGRQTFLGAKQQPQCPSETALTSG